MKNKAFTVIELLLVIVIIGILSTASIRTFGESQKKARDAAKIAELTSSFVNAEAQSAFLKDDNYDNVCNQTELAEAIASSKASCYDSLEYWAIEIELEAKQETLSTPYYCLDSRGNTKIVEGSTINGSSFECGVGSGGGPICAAGSGGIGDPCSVAEDCQSCYCDSGPFGSGCTDGAVGSACGSNSECQSGICPISWTCSAGALGDLCSEDNDCTTRSCGFWSCTNGELGQSCYDGSDCLSGFCPGNQYQCTDGSTGQNCVADDQCQSNSCNTSSWTCN